MKTAKALREERQNLLDELQAIISLAEKESRDLSVDEDTRVDEIQANLEKLNGQLEKREKIDNQIKQIAASRLESQIDRQQLEDNDEPSAKRASVRVPARARIHANLKAFTGPDAERDAYVSGHVILAGLFGNERSAEFCRQHGLVQNTMTGGVDGLKGGFLVPDEMSAAIVRLREERGIFPRFANRVPMGSDNITIPRLITDVTAYWTGEGSEITASDAEIGSAELTAKKLACLTKVSSELDQDAVVAVGDMITESMAYAMADKIDDAGFNGDGTSTYGGVLGLKNALNSSAVQDAATGNDSALELDLADFEATVGKYPQYPGASPRWFMHSAVFYASCARLQNAAGGNTVSDIAGGNMRMFMGYPVEFVQVMPSTTGTLASTIVAYFGDLRLGASIGTRQGLQTAVSVDRYFENDLIGLRCTERIAINVHERGDTVRTRPIVALKTSS